MLRLRNLKKFAEISRFRPQYKSASTRLKTIRIRASLDTITEILEMSEVRRAIVAYWMDHLLQTIEIGTLSLHQRFHNSNAVRQLLDRDIETS